VFERVAFTRKSWLVYELVLVVSMLKEGTLLISSGMLNTDWRVEFVLDAEAESHVKRSDTVYMPLFVWGEIENGTVTVVVAPLARSPKEKVFDVLICGLEPASSRMPFALLEPTFLRFSIMVPETPGSREVGSTK